MGTGRDSARSERRDAPDAPTVRCPACGHRFAGTAAEAASPERKPSVLIAEDTPFFQECVREALGDGFTTRVAPSVRKALDILRTEPVDLLLLDLTLQDGADGREVLRALPKKPCPILVFTAEDEQTLFGPAWDELRRLGADDLVMKGMNVEENLLMKVRALLRERA